MNFLLCFNYNKWNFAEKVPKPSFSKRFLGKSPQNHLIMTPLFMDFLPEYESPCFPPNPTIKHKRVTRSQMSLKMLLSVILNLHFIPWLYLCEKIFRTRLFQLGVVLISVSTIVSITIFQSLGMYKMEKRHLLNRGQIKSESVLEVGQELQTCSILIRCFLDHEAGVSFSTTWIS